MKKDDFASIAKECFVFLKDEYAFKLKIARREGYGYYMLYLSNTTGVEIVFEQREAYLFILLYRLENGVFVKDPISIKVETPVNGYALDDLINIRKPTDAMKPAYKYPTDHKYHDEEDGRVAFVCDFAKNLKKHADDVLRGDFSIFPELDKILRERISRYSNQ